MTALSISKANAVVRTGVLLLAIVTTGCSAADEDESAGGNWNEASKTSNEAQGLRYYRGQGWRRDPRPVTVAPDPIAPPVVAPPVNETGGAASKNPGPFNNGQCAGNGPVTGTCSSYGDQCMYSTSSGSHYCTCLVSAPATPGIQGWDCR